MNKILNLQLKTLSSRIFCGALVLVFFASTPVFAKNQIFSGETGASVTLDQLVRRVTPGSVLLLGEEHYSELHQQAQMQIISALKARALPLSVGLEFLEYPDQSLVDQYRGGQLPETEFLRQIRWNDPASFRFYREQILAPTWGGQAWALNAPRSLTAKVAKLGLSSLTSEEAQLLPPGLTLGNDLYRERFKAATAGHVPESAFENYFWAQSIWDDTMAWKISQALPQVSNGFLVVVVGEFHLQFGGGLPDRLRARGVGRASGHDLVTVSTHSIEGLSEEEIKAILAPSAQYGARADFIFLVE